MTELLITSKGIARCIYSEDLDWTDLGAVSIHRASHCEPDERGRWWADMLLSGGPKLGPFRVRSEAIGAELQWLHTNAFGIGK
jgi:hypothetical protein